MIVSAKSAIWTPADPMTAGPKAFRNALTLMSRRGRVTAAATPARRAANATSSHCSRPEITTPQAAA
jgi:hypothetical protein